MYFVDRAAAIIKPKLPFQQWLDAIDAYEVDLTLETLRADCTVILLPVFETPEEAVAWIDERSEELFRMELAGWCPDEALWPNPLSLKTFWEWFDVEIHSLVMDSVDADIINRPAIDLD